MQRILGQRRIQRFGTQCRQMVELPGARARDLGLATLALEQLRSHDAGHQERDEDDPVERVVHPEGVERREDADVEQHERPEGEREPQRATAGGASAEDHEQERQGHMRLVQARAQQQERTGHKEQDHEPERPLAHPRRGRAHGSATKRYPTAGSVRMMCGRTGSASSFRRSCPT